MPCPNDTTPQRISTTMPSDTRPCEAAMVSRKVSHLGSSAPTPISRAISTRPASRMRGRPAPWRVAGAGLSRVTEVACMSDLPCLYALEQAFRPEHQHHRHHDVDREQLR